MKKNKVKEIETIEVRLTPHNFPIAYKAKLEELMEQEVFETKEEAEAWIQETPIVLELYYEKGSGLFAVESDALDSDGIMSPYSGEELID